MNLLIEEHPFPFFLPTEPRALILGSFPCWNGIDYGGWYYNGSGRNYFWELLGEVYQQPTKDSAQQKKLCEREGLAIGDIAKAIYRKKGNCSDANLAIEAWNKEALSICWAVGLKSVYCTSKFVARHFQRQWPEQAVDLQVLPSPSPAANRYLSGLQEYHLWREQRVLNTLYAYRLYRYKSSLPQPRLVE